MSLWQRGWKLVAILFVIIAGIALVGLAGGIFSTSACKVMIAIEYVDTSHNGKLASFCELLTARRRLDDEILVGLFGVAVGAVACAASAMLIAAAPRGLDALRKM